MPVFLEKEAGLLLIESTTSSEVFRSRQQTFSFLMEIKILGDGQDFRKVREKSLAEFIIVLTVVTVLICMPLLTMTLLNSKLSVMKSTNMFRDGLI